MKKKNKKKRKTKLILVFLIISLLVLGALLIISFKFWEVFEKEKTIKIEIPDECSLFMDNILHQIRDLPDCENSCRSECYILNKQFQEAEFKESSGGCHTCYCYCK
jgi:cytoskeletal protein RodZ